MRRHCPAVKYIISDFIAASLAWLLFNWLRFTVFAVYAGASSFGDYLSYPWVIAGQFIIPLFWLVLHFLSGYYNKVYAKSRLAEFFTTLLTVLIGVVCIFFGLVLDDIPRNFRVYYQLFFGLFALQFFCTYVPRLLITQYNLQKIVRRQCERHVLIIGAGAKASRMGDSLYRLGYAIYGFVHEAPAFAVAVSGTRILGSVSDIPLIMAGGSVDEIVLAADTDDNKSLLAILYSLYRYKCPVKVMADRLNMLQKVKIRTIRGIPLVDVTDNNFSQVEKNIKLVLDKLFSVVALVLLSPLFAWIAWRVKGSSPGPVFFRQERVGYRGEPFIMYKFRTMYTDAEASGPLLASGDDERITPFGRVMRKYRLDELPQFWNVFKGDMSLVGPRPERRYYIERIVKRAPYYYLLHNVRPGITSLGMVKYGYAGDVDQMIERLEYDMLYYENMSLALDLTILIYTVKTVVTGKGI